MTNSRKIIWINIMLSLPHLLLNIQNYFWSLPLFFFYMFKVRTLKKNVCTRSPECVHTFVQKLLHVRVCTCGSQRLGPFLSHFHWVFWDRISSWTSSVKLATGELPDPTASASLALGITHTASPIFSVGARDLNAGLQVCVVSSLCELPP